MVTINKRVENGPGSNKPVAPISRLLFSPREEPLVEGTIRRVGIQNRRNRRFRGVTGTHTGFQVLESMEHAGVLDQLSAYPFTGANLDPSTIPGANRSRLVNFLTQATRVLFSAVSTLFRPSYWRGEWAVSSLRSTFEQKAAGTFPVICAIPTLVFKKDN